PVAVDDVVEAFRRGLDFERSATLNVGGPQQLTLRQVASAVGRAVGAAPVFEQQPGVPPVVVGDCTALRQAFGWAPPTDVERGLREWLESEKMSVRAAG